MIDYEHFEANRAHYGKCSSWAVWNMGSCEFVRFLPSPEVAPKAFSNRAIIKLNAVSSQEDLDNLGWQLRNDIVLVALNFAARSETQFDAAHDFQYAAFHEETTTTSDHRLRDACCGTPLWGAYITDLVKFVDGKLEPIRISSSAEIRPMLREKTFVLQQVNGLIGELEQLGSTSPIIAALGKDVHRVLSSSPILELLRERLGENTRVIKLTHYSKAAAIRHSEYAARINRELLSQGVWF